MKGLIWGIYGNLNGVDYSENISAFTIKGKRKLIHYDLGKLHLYAYNGSTGFQVIDSSSYFIILTGGISVTLPDLELEKDIHQALTDCLRQADGLFTLCIYDKKKDTLFLANDFFGLYPLFYYTNNEYIMFCNEYQPLVIQKRKQLTLSKKSVQSYFEYGFTLHGTTFFDEIIKFKERRILEFSQKKINTKEYATLSKSAHMTFDESVDQLYNALYKAVEKSFSNVQMPLITLTGGLDTRMILALTDEKIRSAAAYITFYLSPLDETNDKDVLIAKKIAELYNLNHTVIPFEEKTKDLHYLYFEEIRNDNGPPKLTGQYGGELLSGILYNKVLEKQINENITAFYSRHTCSLQRLFGDKALKKSLKHQTKKLFYLNVVASSFFTSIYGGTEGSWVHPWMNSLRFFSPYTDTELLKVWNSIPDEHLFNPNRSIYFELYTKYFSGFKKIPTNSMLSTISDHGFTYFEEGLEPKKEKLSKSSHLFESIKKSDGYKIVPAKYKKNNYFTPANRQRLIDFCVWYEYYLKLS